MVKINFIVSLLIVSPTIVGISVDTLPEIKKNNAQQSEKILKVTQKNISTYLGIIDTSTELELEYKQKNVLLSSSVEGKFFPEKTIIDLKNKYQDESTSAWSNKVSGSEYIFITPMKEKSYFKMNWKEYILHNMYFSQYKSEPFKTITMPLAIKSSNLLGVNDDFYKLLADVVYTKDGINPYLFDNMAELINSLPTNFETLRNPLGPLTSISTIQLNLLFRSENRAFAYLKTLDCESFSGKIECDTYSLANMFETKYITENTARFGITDAFRVENYKEHKRFNDLINNKLNFKISYKTVDINNKDKFINVSKTFLYDGINLNIDLKINHGVFIPCSIETIEYEDDTIYIQPDYAILN